MKITKYELFQVPPRWLFLKIETDEGTVGSGELIIEGKAFNYCLFIDGFAIIIVPVVIRIFGKRRRFFTGIIIYRLPCSCRCLKLYFPGRKC